MTKDEKKYLAKVADLGCIICYRQDNAGTPAEIHHVRGIGLGMGVRSGHYDAIPLCPEHHRGSTGLHGLGTKGFEKHYGYDEAALLKDTLELLGVAQEQH